MLAFEGLWIEMKFSSKQQVILINHEDACSMLCVAHPMMYACVRSDFVFCILVINDA